MPPTPAPLVIPPEILAGWSRSMQATEDEAKDAHTSADQAAEETRETRRQVLARLDALEAKIAPPLAAYERSLTAREAAAAKADAEKLEAVGGLRSLASSVLGSTTLRYLLGMAGTGIAAWLAARYGIAVPVTPPQDAAPISQEASP